MVNVAYSYWLRDIPACQYGDIGQQIKAYWQKQGYDIQASGRFSTGKPDISGEARDNFLISLEWSAKGLLTIGATSPCIYRNGTPPPQAPRCWRPDVPRVYLRWTPRIPGEALLA